MGTQRKISRLVVAGLFATIATVAIFGIAFLPDRSAAHAEPGLLPRKVHCGPGIAPIQNFVPAKATHTPKPRYPISAENVWSEGWVVLNYTVAIDGSVRDLIVTDALGPPEFVNRTKQTFAGWKFEPATRNGTPVEQYGLEFIVQYIMQDVGPREAVHEEFIRRYKNALSFC